MNIKRIKISGFKSIADIKLNELTPYSVFAGANGSGKSNFFDALQFVGAVVRFGAKLALLQFNGYNQIHCFKHSGNKARTFKASFDVEINDKAIAYDLIIYDMDKEPKIEEHLKVNNNVLMSRKKSEPPKIKIKDKFQAIGDFFPHDASSLMFLSPIFPLYGFFSNIRVYRFDPLGAKQPDNFNANSSELDEHGHNIATMLAVLEKNDAIREQILEYMELLVPSLEKISTKKQKLNTQQTIIRFKEEGTKAYFSANLISDGTIYALCVMTAVLSRSEKVGMTLIEEPERGIHPKAISELCELMRDKANLKHPIFVTTHSESVVRSSQADELWLVNKIDGKTEFKNAARSSQDLNGLNLDEAWLMNMFGGGLPW